MVQINSTYPPLWEDILKGAEPQEAIRESQIHHGDLQYVSVSIEGKKADVTFPVEFLDGSSVSRPYEPELVETVEPGNHFDLFIQPPLEFTESIIGILALYMTRANTGMDTFGDYMKRFIHRIDMSKLFEHFSHNDLEENSNFLKEPLYPKIILKLIKENTSFRSIYQVTRLLTESDAPEKIDNTPSLRFVISLPPDYDTSVINKIRVMCETNHIPLLFMREEDFNKAITLRQASGNSQGFLLVDSSAIGSSQETSQSGQSIMRFRTYATARLVDNTLLYGLPTFIPPYLKLRINRLLRYGFMPSKLGTWEETDWAHMVRTTLCLELLEGVFHQHNETIYGGYSYEGYLRAIIFHHDLGECLSGFGDIPAGLPGEMRNDLKRSANRAEFAATLRLAENGHIALVDNPLQALREPNFNRAFLEFYFLGIESQDVTEKMRITKALLHLLDCFQGSLFVQANYLWDKCFGKNVEIGHFIKICDDIGIHTKGIKPLGAIKSACMRRLSSLLSLASNSSLGEAYQTVQEELDEVIYRQGFSATQQAVEKIITGSIQPEKLREILESAGLSIKSEQENNLRVRRFGEALITYLELDHSMNEASTRDSITLLINLFISALYRPGKRDSAGEVMCLLFIAEVNQMCLKKTGKCIPYNPSNFLNLNK